MKKFTLAALAAVLLISMGSCGNSAPKAKLKNDVDTVSYAVGMARTQGLKEYLTRQLDVDTAYMSEFVKGLNEGANAGDDKKRAAYYAGIQIGQMMANVWVKGLNQELFGSDSTQTISLKNMMAGFITAATDQKGVFTMEQAQQVLQVKADAIRKKSLEKQYGENKKKGEEFIAKYAKGKDVKSLPGGIYYKVIKEGTGAMPKDTSFVKVNYEGKLIDGKVFDSSYQRKEPVQLHANQFIPGWTEVLTHMPVGSVWEVVIPQDKAYGEREQNIIKPFSTLVFKIELLGVGK